MQKLNEEKIYRLIDANFNRTKEGLRVCEDVARFIFDHTSVTRKYKILRHAIEKIFGKLLLPKQRVIKSRNVRGDVGKKSLGEEFRRESPKDIFYANSQRAKESVRVLEEFVKLVDVRLAEELKKIRYELYALEKTIVKKF